MCTIIHRLTNHSCKPAGINQALRVVCQIPPVRKSAAIQLCDGKVRIPSILITADFSVNNPAVDIRQHKYHEGYRHYKYSGRHGMELSENPDKRKDTDDQERRHKPEGQYTPRRESVQVNIYIYFQNRQKRKANAAERKDSRQHLKRASAAQRILYFTMLCIKEKAEKTQNTEIQDQYPAELLKTVPCKFRSRRR